MLGCHAGFISLVLAGKSDFSVEHAIQIADFLHLNLEEKNYLLLLVQKDRAGSVLLKQHYEAQLKDIQKEKKEIKSRISTTHALSSEEQLKYYEHWFLAALHMCTLVPHLRTPSAMAGYLNLSAETTKNALETLKNLGIITQKGNTFESTQKRIHLGEKNLALKIHHSNWRARSLNSLDYISEADLHYSSIMSISKTTMAEIKQILLKAIQDSEAPIKTAKDEGVFALTIDLYEINKT